MPSRPLTANWRATSRSEELERTYWRADLDDGDWTPVALPHQWAMEPGFGSDSGPVAYRTTFDTPPLEGGERARIRANGVFYYTHFWLDDAYLGDRDGYFLPQDVECTEQLRSGGEHVLALEVDCPWQHDPTAKTVVTGIFSHWDAIDPRFNPGGIWRPVDLVVTGPAWLDDVVALPAEVTPRHSRVDVRIGVDASFATDVTVRTRLTEEASGAETAGFERLWTVREGRNTATFPLHVEAPELWWPHRLGPQPLYVLTLELRGPDGDVWDAQTRTLGIREVTVDNWIFGVNGERLFVRGSNYPPTRMALSEVTRHDTELDVRLAIGANLDLLRIHAHVGAPELYESADRAGLLLWQDFPLQWGYSRRVKKRALDQARGMARALGSHPSIALWCCHNEPFAVEITDTANISPWQAAKFVASAVLPTWNKNVLDPALRKAIVHEDPSRFCDEKSGEVPNTLSYGTDIHMYFGWYFSEMRRFGGMLRIAPRMGRFLSEFGAQSLPSKEAMAEIAPGAAAAWPYLDWSELEARHSLQATIMDRYVPRAGYETLESYSEASQSYQAELIRYHIETLRIRKYEPCGGFCQFQFQSAYPAIDWSVLDHLRIPKLGYEGLREASADVVVLAQWPEAAYRRGQRLSLLLYVVSELRRPLQRLRVTAKLGDSVMEWVGDIEADAVACVGRFDREAPIEPGRHTLALVLSEGDDVLARNTYDVVVDKTG